MSYEEALERIRACKQSGETGLDLSRQDISSLPAEISELTQLQHLDLGRNELITLPPEIGQLTNLQTLDLGGNKLATLPSVIGQLTNLQTLDVRDNPLDAASRAVAASLEARGVKVYGYNKPLTPTVTRTKVSKDPVVENKPFPVLAFVAVAIVALVAMASGAWWLLYIVLFGAGVLLARWRRS